MSSNLPPGVTDSTLPGNRPEDLKWEAFYQAIEDDTVHMALEAEEAYKIWEMGTVVWTSRKRKEAAFPLSAGLPGCRDGGTKMNEIKVGDKFYPPEGVPFINLSGESFDSIGGLADCKFTIVEVYASFVKGERGEYDDGPVCIFNIDDIRDHIIREPERLPLPDKGPPAPMREKPEEGQEYWTIDIYTYGNIKPKQYHWDGGGVDSRLFDKNLCWRTEAEVQEFCRWLKELLAGKGE